MLVAYNLWLAGASIDRARAIAKEIRSPSVRALGFELGSGIQVSVNLVDPAAVGPCAIYDRVAALARIERAELVGLVPEWVLRAQPSHRWAQLGLSPDCTIEARLGRI